MKLLSDQVDQREISVILRELKSVIERGTQGDVVEFGCYVGTTSVYLANEIKNSNRKLWVYDSFEGLPDKTAEDNSPLGDQFRAGELLATKKQFITNFKKNNLSLPIIKKAWFSDLTEADVPNNIAFAFLDGDYYESIRQSLKLIAPYLVKGSTIVIDDYASDELPGAKKAVDEWVREKNLRIRVEHSLAIINFS